MIDKMIITYSINSKKTLIERINRSIHARFQIFKPDLETSLKFRIDDN